MKAIQDRDPYQLMFPMGVVLAFIGALFWTRLVPTPTEPWPINLHSSTMVLGFLFCFICGFLMTALPRFTATDQATPAEKFYFLVTAAGIFWAATLQHLRLIHWFHLVLVLSLVRFAVVRFVKRSAQPPPPFLFLGVGFLMGVLGSVFALMNDYGIAPLLWQQMGKRLLFEGMVSCFIFGIGSRLIPAFLGHMENPTPLDAGQGQKSLPKMQPNKLWIGLAIVFFVSFMAYGLLPHDAVGTIYEWPLLLRTLIISFILIRFWRIFRKPQRKSFQGLAVFIAGWCLFLGHWLAFIFPIYRVHMMHLAYVGGFGLITLAVSIRVILAHGGHDVNLETTSKWVPAIVATALLAAIIRVTAPFAEGRYTLFLQVAAFFWIATLFLWLAFLLKKLFHQAER